MIGIGTDLIPAGLDDLSRADAGRSYFLQRAIDALSTWRQKTRHQVRDNAAISLAVEISIQAPNTTARLQAWSADLRPPDSFDWRSDEESAPSLQSSVSIAYTELPTLASVVQHLAQRQEAAKLGNALILLRSPSGAGYADLLLHASKAMSDSRNDERARRADMFTETFIIFICAFTEAVLSIAYEHTPIRSAIYDAAVWIASCAPPGTDATKKYQRYCLASNFLCLLAVLTLIAISLRRDVLIFALLILAACRTGLLPKTIGDQFILSMCRKSVVIGEMPVHL